MAKESRERRSNPDRTAEMKARLLETATACLIETGYAQTSNLDVCKRAGVSNGALLHHFQTRESFMVAVMERLYEKFTQEVSSEVAAIEPGTNPIDHAVDVLWLAMETGEFKAIVEIWIAAANDEDLSRRVLPVMEQFAASLDEIMHPFFSEHSAEVGQVSDVLDLMFYAVQGMGLDRMAYGPNSTAQGVRPLLKKMLRLAIREESDLVD